jgi:hypothetical protein
VAETDDCGSCAGAPGASKSSTPKSWGKRHIGALSFANEKV